jgi:hypothetical protein
MQEYARDVRIWALAFAVSACSFRPTPLSTTTDSPDAGAAVPGDWWNTDFTTRLPITIVNGSNAALPIGFQIGVPYDLVAAPCASTSTAHDDVRAVYRGAEIVRVIDRVGPPAWTWFRLSAPIAAGATSTGDYWLYCDNPAAPALQDLGSAVFDFYDSFDALDTTRWTASHSPTIANGMLQCQSLQSDVGVVTKQSVTALAHAVDFAIVMQTGDAHWWGGFQDGTVDGPPWTLWDQPDPGTSGTVSPSYSDTNGNMWTGTFIAQDTVEHIYGVEDEATTMIFSADDRVVQIEPYAPSDPPPSSLDIRLWNNSLNSGQTISFDWVRLRQAVVPAPTASVGSADHI